jgi:hypothetical protein
MVSQIACFGDILNISVLLNSLKSCDIHFAPALGWGFYFLDKHINNFLKIPM